MKRVIPENMSDMGKWNRAGHDVREETPYGKRDYPEYEGTLR